MERRPDMWELAGLASLTGGLTGAGVGGVSSLLRGARNPGALARAAIGGGLGAGALTGGGTMLGSMLMGRPRRDDETAYTDRAGLGGALVGGGGGGGLGALLASGIVTRRPKLASWLARTLPMNNLIGDVYGALSRQPSIAKTLLGGGLGSAIGGIGGGYFGASEGMGVDSVNARRS